LWEILCRGSKNPYRIYRDLEKSENPPNDQRPTSNNQQPTTNNQQPTTNTGLNLPGEEEDNNELNNGNNNRELEEEEQPTEAYPELKLATLNIIDGRKNRLNAALRCMQQMNVDVGLLTETKFHNDMFTKGAEGYTVTGTITEGNAGGVALIHRTRKGWGLESTRTFGPNVIRTTLVSGQRRWHIIGVYIPPSEENGETLDLLTQAYESIHNPNWPVILLGDLNVDLQNPGGNHAAGAGRRLETAALMATWGMEPLRNHFRQRRERVGRRWTWQRLGQENEARSVCDHIMTDKRQYFTNCQLRQPRFDTDHRALIAFLRLGPIKNIEDMYEVRINFQSSPSLSLTGIEVMLCFKI